MKRFSETTKWNDPWFRNLSPTNKLYWLWLLDNCDCAGIIEPDLGLARFMLGASEELPTPLEAFGSRIIQQGQKFLIVKFIRYQYGDSLNPSNNAHKGVLKRLESSEFKEFKQSFDIKKEAEIEAPSEGLVRGLQAHQEQEQDKDKELEKDEEKEPKPKSRGTLQQFKSYAKEIELPESDGEYMHANLCENGWKRGKQEIKDWKASMRKWKSAGWLPSQKASTPKTQLVTANDETMIQINTWFGRNPDELWTIEEKQAWDAIPENTRTENQIQGMAWFYGLEKTADSLNRRTSLLNLLTNWRSELDKARAYARKSQNI